jgi:UDP-GlcNAc:undecaprenyl-phosphate/decaprenyl-phosphate GlcNAc-1-phosphate transferase
MTDVANTYPLFLFANIILGLALAILLGRAAIWVTNKVGPIDMPNALPHKKHMVPIPLAGGITLLMAVFAGAVVFNLQILREMWNVLLPSLIVFCFGLWDDFKSLPAWIKFLGQLAASVLLVVLGTYVQIFQPGFLGLPGGVTVWLNWFVTIFWMVGITNALNLIDSMDGIVVGVSSIGLSFLILITLGSPQVALLRLLALMLGVCLGLNYYNATPARFFLGDSGAQTFGFLLAAIGIQFTPGTHPQGSSWFLPILILGLPIFDTSLVVFSRLSQGKHVFEAGRDHTYHRLVDMGFDPARAVQLMHLASIILCCVAFIALRFDPLYANVIFAGTCALGIGLILYLIRRK